MVSLAGNRLSVQSCVVLAAGMRASRCLQEMNLDDNPLGPEGGAAIIEALVRRHVGNISLQGCNFSSAANNLASSGEVYFDIQRPNRVYSLDLSSAAHYAVAAILVRYWQHESSNTWHSATLDGVVCFQLVGRGKPGKRSFLGCIRKDFQTCSFMILFFFAFICLALSATCCSLLLFPCAQANASYIF
jgi:hypothetical protein